MLIINLEQAQQIIDDQIFRHFGEHLKNVEILLFRESWNGLTYQEMAQRHHLSVNYLRGDIGPKLWQKLSAIAGEIVTKNNFKNIINQLAQQLQMLEPIEDNRSDIDIQDLREDYPEGFVALDSTLYIERDRIDSRCQNLLLKPGKLIQARSSRFMGKTSLMIRALKKIKEQDYQSVYIDLRQINHKIISDVDCFMICFLEIILNALNLDRRIRNEQRLSIDNIVRYYSSILEEQVLFMLDVPLVLGIDHLDFIFNYPEVTRDFMQILWAWHGKTKSINRWQNLRLMTACSTESQQYSEIQSFFFDFGIPLVLPDFNRLDLQRLLTIYKIRWQDIQQETFMDYLGGHPYLIRLALYEIFTHQLTFENFFQIAKTDSGVFGFFLRYYYQLLRSLPELLEGFRRVVMSPTPIQLNLSQAERLCNMGLILRQGNFVTIKCRLYRDYFQSIL